MKKIFTLLFMLMATLSGYSQLSKTHYIPPITSANSEKPFSGTATSTDPDVNQYIYISTPSTTPVTVTLTPIGGTPVIQAVTNATPWVYTITTSASFLNGSTLDINGNLRPPEDGFDNQLFVDYSLTGTVQNNRGFLIEASDLVYVNIRVSSRVASTPPKSSQAGGLVSKGLSAYGTEFRIGGMENKAALDNSNYGSLVNFASFIATEDNTTVTITLPRGVIGQTTFHNGTKYTGPVTVTLNKNESYVFAIPNTSSSSFDSNIMLGGLIKSDRNIVVNCGSIAGSSQIKDEVIANKVAFNNAGKDYGFDQIVSSEKTGKEYIFVGGYGITAKYYDLERAIIIANVNNTQVFKDGTTLVATLNAGEYYVFNGNDYTNGNLYVTTSENVFAYQCIAGKPRNVGDAAGNQNMFFVPSLNCTTSNVVNNIPLLEQNGIVTYANTVVNIVTESTAAVQVNGLLLTAANATINAVAGNSGFVTYTYPQLGVTPSPVVGNISVIADKQVYVSYYGSSENATYGSYYSGFTNDLATLIAGTGLTATQTGASYQWYKCSGTLLDGETNQSYTPTVDGDYKVEITSLSGCSITSDCITFSSTTLGTKDVNADSKLVLYPNPTTGILNIESNIEDNFTVFNQLGQVVKTVKVNVGTNKVNLENLVDGVYFLKNKSGENQVVKKIIKN